MEPKIRFKGFEGEWKSKAFQESFVPLKNNSLSRAELTDDGEIANVHYGDVLIKYSECVDTSVDKLTYILDNEIGKNLVKNGALKRGDIIFADAAEDNSVGKCSELICEDNELIVSGLHTIACRPQIDVAERYLGYYLNSPAYHNQLLPHIQGTKISSISRKAINTTSVVIPTQKKEQQTIAFYFTSLDSQISASTSRLASLKQMKAASLQAMFPQEGETVPKVRFKGFEGKWKSLKIGDIAPLQRGYDLPTHSIIKGSIPVVSSNGILRFHNIGKCQAPAIITGRSGTIGKFTYIDQGEYWPHNTSLWVTSFHENYPRFVYYLFQNVGFEKYATGSGVPTLNRNDIHKHIISIPSNIEEQRAIANYFTSLDRQITLQTQRLEKLKQIKSACLDKMFV